LSPKEAGEPSEKYCVGKAKELRRMRKEGAMSIRWRVEAFGVVGHKYTSVPHEVKKSPALDSTSEEIQKSTSPLSEGTVVNEVDSFAPRSI
jgi:hypothetical protein